MSVIHQAERYFAIRERISDLLLGIKELAVESGAAGQDGLDEFHQSLRKPFRWIVCGEVNAGKSTLLNALCGRELCEVGPLPVTTRIDRYRHGANEQLRDGETVREIVRPLDFLADFELIDAPGTNGLGDGVRREWQRLAATADLVLAVFPLSNPWLAATWDWIGQLPVEVQERTALVLLQADLYEAADVELILGHVTDLSRNRVGRVLPTFAVSAMSALEASDGKPGNAAKLEQSGLPRLEAWIAGTIDNAPGRRALLVEWRDHASEALRRLDTEIDGRCRQVGHEMRMMEQIDGEIDALRGDFGQRLPTYLFDLEALLNDEVAAVARMLRSRLGLVRSWLRLFGIDRTSHRIEEVLIERLGAAMGVVASKIGNDAAEVCAQHRGALAERYPALAETIQSAPGSMDEAMASARERMIHHLGMTVEDRVRKLKVRKCLENDLRQRNLALRSFTVSFLVMLIFAGVAGGFGFQWVALACCALAGGFFLGGIMVGWITRSSVARDFHSRLGNADTQLAAALHHDFSSATNLVFRAYTLSLDPARRRLADRKKSTDPLLQRWQKLFLTLKAIEQDW